MGKHTVLSCSYSFSSCVLCTSAPLNEVYYQAGTTTITDLLKAQSLFRKSNDQFVDAFGDYQIKTVEYLEATGR